MHEIALRIGYATLDLLASIGLALSITVTGWLGIFVVTGVIIGVVNLLNWACTKLAKDA